MARLTQPNRGIRHPMIEHAILLSAGQGSRLLPLTAERPKCLIDFSGRSLLAWQIEMLARGGVKRIDVVTGFMTDMVEEHLSAIRDPRVEIAVRFNPFRSEERRVGKECVRRVRIR